MTGPFSQDELGVELYQASPVALHSLDLTAHLAGVSRRSLLLYCRAGIVSPIYQPPYGVMVFAEQAVYAVRRAEDLRSTHGVGVAWIKIVFDLADEVDRLRTEVRFHRNR